MTPDTMGPFHEKKALIERAAAHGIKSKLNKREWLERQTVIDPIPALFVCVCLTPKQACRPITK